MTSGSWDLRGRAESFGAVADEYDAVRPRYPAEVVAAIVAGDPPSRPARERLTVLDVGTGTGILARALLAEGADVVGTDVDEGMAAVARRSGLTVHVAPFETLVLDATFDRITVAQAWHWIEPTAGLAAARRMLAPTGQLWLVWNSSVMDPAVRAGVDEVYASFPEMEPDGATHDVTRIAAGAAEEFLRGQGIPVRTRSVEWHLDMTTAEWIRLMRTASDHATLADPTRTDLFTALAAAIDSAGGIAPLTYTTRVVVASDLTG